MGAFCSNCGGRCVEVCNSSDNPFYTLSVSQLDNPTVVVPIEELAAEEGVFFAVSTGPTNVPANGFLALQITNPAGSGKEIVISRLSGGATVNTTISVLRNGSFPAAGTALTPRNTNFSASDNSIATAKFISQSSDPTVGGVLINSIVQPGGVFVIEYTGRVRVTPNTTLLVRTTNNTNQTNLLSLNISYWEENI
ncbi:hypothetical protein HXA31_01420 [Salipaludibacillus agaradhaerens]|jgi:hypothetical protein|uniref:Uncharacterized protein n=1 Tax=Salipaludibacillus agaradhaerens TaxID=76935 RepID=A0A9Q4B312_SALAG|nr:hypothetical protein [Salipaludibacillus agaradhaerens]MCR6097493.1 hypothetical protein [Salipaludibacillus agaradhaerens]MCR6113023.1 hypothetical protein [Salipaludibacillus agaradhaerens]